MTEQQWTYNDAEWQEAVAGRPLQHLPLPQLMLLHRHWVWAIRERDLFETELRAGRTPKVEAMAEDAISSMFMWYALLWSVLEGLHERTILLRGRFTEDIAFIGDGLRRCRNAVFHIPRDDYYDSRFFEFMEEPDSASRVRRISSGLGRLFLEEFDKRGLPKS